MLFVRKLHKWLGLIVGLQLVLWTVSGAVFAWLDHHAVEARHHIREPEPAWLPVPPASIEPAAWLPTYAPAHVYELRLVAIAGKLLWRVELENRVELRRATDGEVLRLDEPVFRKLALTHYSGPGQLQSLDYLADSTLEARKSGRVWRARFADDQSTTLYFAADDGRFIAARNSAWRAFDFFWMLHTMDYVGRDDFNNPLVITAASIALWLAFSGLVLLTRSFRRPRVPT